MPSSIQFHQRFRVLPPLDQAVSNLLHHRTEQLVAWFNQCIGPSPLIGRKTTLQPVLCLCLGYRSPSRLFVWRSTSLESPEDFRCLWYLTYRLLHHVLSQLDCVLWPLWSSDSASISLALVGATHWREAWTHVYRVTPHVGCQGLSAPSPLSIFNAFSMISSPVLYHSATYPVRFIYVWLLHATAWCICLPFLLSLIIQLQQAANYFADFLTQI